MRLQRGFSILEGLIAIVISMILLAGVLQVFIGNKNVYRLQTNFTEVQENGRFAASYLSRIIRLAGYRTPPITAETFTDMDALFPTSGTFTPAGSVVTGTNGANDTLAVRYQGSGNGTGTPDGTVRDCLNQPIDANTIATSTFSLTANNELQCQAVNPNASPANNTQILVSNVENMQVLFGEDVDGDGTADRYVASSFPTLDLTRVVSVRVSLLIRSTEGADLTPTSVSYYMLGQNYTPANSTFLREQITFTVVLRNLISEPS